MKSHLSDKPLRFRFLLAIILLVSFYVSADGQTWTQYDQGTPPQHAAGVSPLGSYQSTELGTVNLSNGSLNIALPMGTVGGRGFSLPLSLNFSSKVWSVAHDVAYDPTCSAPSSPVTGCGIASKTPPALGEGLRYSGAACQSLIAMAIRFQSIMSWIQTIPTISGQIKSINLGTASKSNRTLPIRPTHQ